MDLTLKSLIALLTVWGLRMVTATLILVGGWLIGNWVRRAIQNIKKFDNTLKSFLGGFLRYAILAVAFITVLGQFGVQTASLLAVLGAAGLAIGLALQGTLSNVAAGVMLLILRPFNVGDYIETGTIKGTVKELGLFGTELATIDNVFIFAPNSQIWNTEIFNFNRNTHRRMDLVFAISYDDNIDTALKIIKTTVEKEPRLISSTKEKEPVYFVGRLGDFSIDITARIWVKTTDYWQVRWDLTKSVKEALDKSGITIPFPPQYQQQRSRPS